MRAAALILAVVLVGVAAWLFFVPMCRLPLKHDGMSDASSMPPPAPAPAKKVATPTRLAPGPAQRTSSLKLTWGDGPDQVGRRRDPESAHEGPMALSVARDGALCVLDQVNGRVLCRDRLGHARPPIKVRASAQDLRSDGNGVAVLDRLGAQTLQRFDADGRVREERPLSSYGVTEAGGTTGLFDDANGALYIEESLVGLGKRVLHAVDSATVLPGRPSRGDATRLVAAAITARDAGELEVRGMSREDAPQFTTPLSVGRPILSIPLLDTDSAGNLYVGVLHARKSNARDFTDEKLDLFRLSPDGVILARTSVPHPPSALESFRELAVGGDGVVWWMHPLPDDSGETVEQILF
jgi:hypothetical protein